MAPEPALKCHEARILFDKFESEAGYLDQSLRDDCERRRHSPRVGLGNQMEHPLLIELVRLKSLVVPEILPLWGLDGQTS